MYRSSSLFSWWYLHVLSCLRTLLRTLSGCLSSPLPWAYGYLLRFIHKFRMALTRSSQGGLRRSSRVRNYRREYRRYYGPHAGEGKPSKLQLLHRKHNAARHAAKRIILKALGLKALPKGLEVDHKNHNPLDNRLSNLRLMSVNRNRGKCRMEHCP